MVLGMKDYNKTFVKCCNPRASLDERINARGKSHQQYTEKLAEELRQIHEKIDKRQQQLLQCDTSIRFHKFLHNTRNDPNSTQLQQIAYFEEQKVKIAQDLDALKQRRSVLFAIVH